MSQSAVSNERSTHKRTSLVIGVIVAFLCLCAAALFGLNAAVSANFNVAAVTLSKNIATVKKDADSLDIEAIEDSQTQVNAQLSDANSTAMFQLPSVKASIANAISASRNLDDTVAALKKKQQGATSSQGAVLSQTPSDTASGADADSDSSDTAQKQAQQKKLEALLKQNETSESDGASGTGNSTTTSPDTSTSKPW